MAEQYVDPVTGFIVRVSGGPIHTQTEPETPPVPTDVITDVNTDNS